MAPRQKPSDHYDNQGTHYDNQGATKRKKNDKTKEKAIDFCISRKGWERDMLNGVRIDCKVVQ